MPARLKRYHGSEQIHFITFTCFHRLSLLECAPAKRTFEAALERVRRAYRLCVYGYVVTPEHVHLLVSEPERSNLAQAIKSLKQGVSRRLIGERDRFWQTRYYDHNVRSYESFVGKLKYIHRNPVKCGLCARPDDWEWSSFRHYATGVEGAVEIESEWTARRRERAGVTPTVAAAPHSSQTGLEWATISVTGDHPNPTTNNQQLTPPLAPLCTFELQYSPYEGT
ncbi:MAG TPA: transposase [Terriglobales bacterium]|nr:transposase [Terriglobales bacterium]